MTGTAVTKKSSLKATLEERAPAYQRLLPKWYPADRLITGALVAAQTNPDLAKCNPQSVAVALARVAQWGLDVGDTAHLVPFGDKCTPIADYKGLIRLMVEAGARKVEAREVRDGDRFEVRYGTSPDLQHQPSTNRSGRITHYYAVVWLRDGETQFEVMTAEEVEALKTKHSRAWKNQPTEAWYGRKTVIRRLAKYINKTPRLLLALTEDEQIDPETGEILNPPPLDLPAETTVEEQSA